MAAVELDVPGHLLGVSHAFLCHLQTVKDFSHVDHLMLPDASAICFTGTPLSGEVVYFLRTLRLLQSMKSVFCVTAPEGEHLGWW